MKLLARIAVPASFFLFFGVAHADTHTAVVRTLQVHPPTNGGYVQLAGVPNFSGGVCNSPWAIGRLDDQNFMVYIWPALMSAKNQGKSVTITVSGCVGNYPLIEWIQVNES